MQAEERQKDIKELIARCRASGAAFSAYHHVYSHYRNATIQRRGVSVLLELNQRCQNARYCARKHFLAFDAHLSSLFIKYEGDAMGKLFQLIKLHVDSWDQNNIRSKYAADWMRAFELRLRKLHSLRQKLNSSPKRQQQIRLIASEAFSSNLRSASKTPEVADR